MHKEGGSEEPPILAKFEFHNKKLRPMHESKKFPDSRFFLRYRM
jgi:hypothetical protein